MEHFDKFISRANNFYLDEGIFKGNVDVYKHFFVELFNLNKSIQSHLDSSPDLCNDKVVSYVGAEVYKFIISHFKEFELFDKDSELFLSIAPSYEGWIVSELSKVIPNIKKISDSDAIRNYLRAELPKAVFSSCFFTALCVFINSRKKDNGRSTNEFLYDFSLMDYNIANLHKADDLLLSEANLLRKTRQKLTSSREVHIQRDEWSTISPDTEYEMSIAWNLKDLKPDLADTYKRIGNLYNHIHDLKKLDHSKDFRLETSDALKKTLSKIKKLKYDNFLELGRGILEQICDKEGKKFYVINLYRFEKKLNLFNITKEVKMLSKCNDKAAEEGILLMSSILSGITFPNLYIAFSHIKKPYDMFQCKKSLDTFRSIYVSSSLLILDEVVEKNRLGEGWYDFFCEGINEIANEVLYRPDEVDYSAEGRNQEAFERILSAPAYNWYSQNSIKGDDE